MLPSRHIALSLPLGVSVGLFTQSTLAGILCFLTGVFIDIDHFIEYVIRNNLKNFNFKECYRSHTKWAKREEEIRVERIYLVFHAVEIAFLLWVSFIFTKYVYILSIALGYTGHLVLDMTGNIVRPSAYFVTTRIKNNFKTIKLLRNR